MTLREMIDAHPDKFYAGQTWFNDEAFQHTHARDDVTWPKGVLTSLAPRPFGGAHARPDRGTATYTAADLASLWLMDVQTPGFDTDGLWDRYLWTSDTDSQGQRIYVGQNGKGLEIHRHLHLTERWGVPI